MGHKFQFRLWKQAVGRRASPAAEGCRAFRWRTGSQAKGQSPRRNGICSVSETAVVRSSLLNGRSSLQQTFTVRGWPAAHGRLCEFAAAPV